MRGRYRRRYGRAAQSGHSLFGSTGWLFADLMLALALVFLLATTVGATPKPASATHPKTSPTKLPPKPKAAPKPKPALDLHYVDITVKNVDAAGIIAGNTSAFMPVLAAISKNPRLRGQSAGLVLLYAGGESGGFSQWQKLDADIWRELQGSGADSGLFKVAVPRDFESYAGSPSEFELNIYLFKQSLPGPVRRGR